MLDDKLTFGNSTMHNTRRQFLAQAAAGTLASLTVSGHHSVLGEDATQELPLVDTHQHLWDLDRQQLPWLEGAPEILRRSYVTKDYRAATEGLGLAQAVYMEVDVAENQLTQEAEHVVGLCQSPDHPTSGAVIGSRPGSESFAGYIRQFADNDYVKGVRRVLHTPKTPRGHCLQENFVASMRLLGELGKSFDLCMRPDELADAVSLADRCPATRFVLDHCGNADPKVFMKNSTPTHDAANWKRQIGQLADRSNVICKISGIVARAPEGWEPHLLAPVINHCLDEFGPDRVVFGGDWPVCLLGAEYAQWVNGLKQVISERPHSEQRKLLHDNAVKFYGLT